ncbi:hypothetical protein RCOM_1598630 [Ricinus communis]|uniref:Uncharacterized protein n=2 Tax=Ricinus communis TaxID=3988 RepID=B9R8C5_RICCO|nr:hypothetical protein RCOM_1598630 [Ricinus communis]
MDISNESDGRESNSSSDDEIVNTCLKCNKGGKLLICCGAGCAICLHVECIPRKPKYDEEGNFHCPYCWYKLQQARAQEWKKMALLAKKALSDFMDSRQVEVGNDKAKLNDRRINGADTSVGPERNCCEHFTKMDVDDEVRNETGEVEEDQNEKNVKISDGCRSTEVVEHENVSKIHEFEVLHNDEGTEKEKDNEQVIDQWEAGILEGEEQEDPFNTNCIEEETLVDDALRGSAELKSEALKVSEGNQARKEEEEGVHEDAPAANCTGGDVVADVPKMSDSDNETLAARLSWAKQRANQKANSTKKSSHHPDNISVEKARNQNEKVIPLKKSRQTQAPAKKLTNLSFPHEKRKRLHWKPEEEEMLREGVQKFSTTVNKNLPWKKILEFGHHVFDGSRTPADLKDKWRNIVAKDSSAVNGRTLS